MPDKTYAFPPGFLWGTASAAHQIEGNQANSWTEWEQSPHRIADLKRQGLNPGDFQSGMAANSWEHLEDDIAAIKKLNNNAYRFSVEWSRIEPEEGVFDRAVIEKYHHFIIRLREEGIEPFVTLWHWTLPLWLSRQGGWEHPKSVFFFERFVDAFVSACPEVTFWMPLNEPNVYSGDSYMSGKWPPQKKNPVAYLRVYHRLIGAHKAAAAVIRKRSPQARIGVASNIMYFDGKGLINKALAAASDWWWNRYFLKRIKGQLDFIGLNYYFHITVSPLSFAHDNDKALLSDMGWELYPKGLYFLAKNLQSFGLPIYVTEHGLADEADKNRAWYISESLRWLQQAIEEGVDVKGYFHWSLLDNFEWASGLGKKFGLFSINRTTWERVPRPSAATYAKVAKANAVTVAD